MLPSVDAITADVQRLDNQLQGNIRCFDLRMRYKLGKEAKKQIDTVNRLQRNFSTVSYPNPIQTLNHCLMEIFTNLNLRNLL